MVSRRVVEDVLLGFVDSDTGDIDGMVVHGVAPGRILRLQECMGFWRVLGLDVWRYFQPQQLHLRDSSGQLGLDAGEQRSMISLRSQHPGKHPMKVLDRLEMGGLRRSVFEVLGA